MVGVKRSISFLLLTALAAWSFVLLPAINCLANIIPYEDLSGTDYVSDSDEIRLDAVIAEIVARPELSEGPARIEGAEYYLHEMIRDENWETWTVFKHTPRTIIPMTSAKFYVYANVAMAKLKRPGILVIMERKAPQKPVDQGAFKQVKKSPYSSLDSYGLIQKGEGREKKKGWDLGSLLDINTEVGPATEREWDFWFIAQKFFLVASYIVGGLIFVELLRVIFGVGARALASGARRSEGSRRKRKRRV